MTNILLFRKKNQKNTVDEKQIRIENPIENAAYVKEVHVNFFAKLVKPSKD